MRDLIIPQLDDALLVELKRRAWHQGLPLQESLRRLLIASVETDGEGAESHQPVPFLARVRHGSEHTVAVAPVALHA